MKTLIFPRLTLGALILSMSGLLGYSAVSAQGLDLLKSFSTQDSQTGLKQALTQAAEKTVRDLAASNGFYDNPKVRIGLPDKITPITKTLKQFGMGKQVDALELSINRAAEAAVPEAKALLTQAIKSMSVADAKAILQGGPTSATDYFHSKTADPLAEKFKPIIQKSMEKVKLADSYNALAGKASAFGLISADEAQLDSYITKKTLDGLFTLMGEEEKQLRQNPTQAVGNIAKKLFGALKL